MNVRRVSIVVLVLWALGVWIGSPGNAAAQPSTPEKMENEGGSLDVGDDVIRWKDGWQLNTDSTNETLVTLLFNDSSSGAFTLLTYSPAQSPEGTEPMAVLDGFEVSLKQSDIGEVTPLVEGQTEQETVWRTFELDLQGISLMMVVGVSPTSENDYSIVTMTTTREQLEASVERVQADISVDGKPGVFAGIEPSVVVPPPATPSIWPGND